MSTSPWSPQPHPASDRSLRRLASSAVQETTLSTAFPQIRHTSHVCPFVPRPHRRDSVRRVHPPTAYPMVSVPGGTVDLRDDRRGTRWQTEIAPFLLGRFPVTADLHRAGGPAGALPVVERQLAGRDRRCATGSPTSRVWTGPTTARRKRRGDLRLDGHRLPAADRGGMAVRVQGRHQPDTGTASSTTSPGTRTTPVAGSTTSAARRPTRGGCTTCWATSGSGAGTCTTRRSTARTGSSAAAAGPSRRGAAGPPCAAAATPRSRSTTSACGSREPRRH